MNPRIHPQAVFAAPATLAGIFTTPNFRIECIITGIEDGHRGYEVALEKVLEQAG